MKKIRILWCGESAVLNTGYAVYGREILSRIFQDERLEVAEFAAYIHPNDPRLQQVPWKVYANLPDMNHQEQVNQYNSDPMNQFGAWRFEQVCLDFRPHIVTDIRDFWMLSFQDTSPFRPYYKWLIMPTVDSYPQNEQWLSTYMTADGVFTYQDWSAKVLNNETNGKIRLFGSAPPAAAPEFQPLANREQIRKMVGLDKYTVIGTVMRNQRRKLYPDLFLAFKKFLEETQRKDVVLYCHTSYPDNNGWDIPKLLIDMGIASKVFFTYVCNSCGQAFPERFSGASIPCKRCGHNKSTLANTQFGVNNETLNIIYNMFDVYAQIANSEGFGMPQAEAAAAAVPVMAVDFSGMSDVVRKLKGWPIRVLKEDLEIETGCYRAIVDVNDLVNKIKVISKLSKSELTEWKKQTREAYEQSYSWDVTANKWFQAIMSVNPEEQDNAWRSPPRLHKPANRIPQHFSNSDFSKWLIADVLGEPNRLNSFMETRLTKDLNYGTTTGTISGMYYNELSALFDRGNMREFNREIAYNHMVSLCERRNFWERQRHESITNRPL